VLFPFFGIRGNLGVVVEAWLNYNMTSVIINGFFLVSCGETSEFVENIERHCGKFGIVA
jgi:hypothetical protein